LALLSAFVCTSDVAAQPTAKTVSDGQKVKQRGIINKRDGDVFTMSSLDNTELYTVELTPKTDVKTHRKGAFRGGTEYPVSYLLRGLRVEVEGKGNANGGITASSIRFDDEDLRTAQVLQVRVDPVEQQAVSNTGRISAAEEVNKQQQAELQAQAENAKRMAGQISENTALANQAQATADKAVTEADRANSRINGLDTYDPIKTIIVPFDTGSYTLNAKAKTIIDEATAWVRTQDRRGWMVAIVGFADSTGRTAANKTLSERRANAVIGYLVSQHNMPLTRLVQPFGAGVDDPIATNDTAEGRAQNRRVEIRLLKNKGIAGDE
jgi:outer membrane protein OmpA-like peptidoglycan-associated protein